MVMKPQQSLYALAVLALVAGLAACGGGGGGGSSPIPVGGPPTPVSSPVSSPGAQTCGAPGQACVTGTVVDASHTYVLATPTADPPTSVDTPGPNASPVPMPTHAPTYGLPLAGVPVALMPWTTGDNTPVAQTTTAANGTFSLPVAPGHYLLVVGNNTPVPFASPWPTTWTTTLHMQITAVAGNDPIVVPTPYDYPPTPVQASGNLRIQTLVEPQLSCFIALNAARAVGQPYVAGPPSIPAEQPAPPEIADEFLTEYTQAQADQMAAVYPVFASNGNTGTTLASRGLLYTEPMFGFGNQLLPTGFEPIQPVTTPPNDTSPGTTGTGGAACQTLGATEFENAPFGVQAEIDDPNNVWQGLGVSNIYGANLDVYDIR